MRLAKSRAKRGEIKSREKKKNCSFPIVRDWLEISLPFLVYCPNKKGGSKVQAVTVHKHKVAFLRTREKLPFFMSRHCSFSLTACVRKIDAKNRRERQSFFLSRKKTVSRLKALITGPIIKKGKKKMLLNFIAEKCRAGTHFRMSC